jgi:hypothetical protein
VDPFIPLHLSSAPLRRGLFFLSPQLPARLLGAACVRLFRYSQGRAMARDSAQTLLQRRLPRTPYNQGVGFEEPRTYS